LVLNKALARFLKFVADSVVGASATTNTIAEPPRKPAAAVNTTVAV
jgi:hypothetical protein